MSTDPNPHDTKAAIGNVRVAIFRDATVEQTPEVDQWPLGQILQGTVANYDLSEDTTVSMGPETLPPSDPSQRAFKVPPELVPDVGLSRPGAFVAEGLDDVYLVPQFTAPDSPPWTGSAYRSEID